MELFHYVGAAAILVIITLIGLYSGRQVHSAKDFAGGGHRAGAGLVAGAIIGTLVGGASTIGTAQLAFSYGFSAWWFTLGAGLGCLVLALFYCKPLYESGTSTLPQLLSREYGAKAGATATMLTGVGSFLSIVSQVLSGIALITSVSVLDARASTLITVGLMLVYVVFGGVWGAGLVGLAKTVFMYVAVGLCGLIAVRDQGGLAAFSSVLDHGQYFNLFAGGVAKDGGRGLSLILGVLTTQAYIQSLLSAKTVKLARGGALISAALVPVIGIAGIYVGMYMKLNSPEINAASALPLFILEKLPPLLGGAAIAALLVAVVGTGAGIALGLSSMFCNDIYKKYSRKEPSDGKMLAASRIVIVAVLAVAALFTLGNMGSLILNWSFMSMGLRAAVAFWPLCATLFLPGRIPAKYVLVSMVLGPVAVLLWKLFAPAGIDPLFPGMLVSLIPMAIGYFAGKRGVKKP